eukprot:12638854-Alexandrium_andersonii.AAC.1
MSASLVGSEMCIRDSPTASPTSRRAPLRLLPVRGSVFGGVGRASLAPFCILASKGICMPGFVCFFQECKAALEAVSQCSLPGCLGFFQEFLELFVNRGMFISQPPWLVFEFSSRRGALCCDSPVVCLVHSGAPTFGSDAAALALAA